MARTKRDKPRSKNHIDLFNKRVGEYFKEQRQQSGFPQSIIADHLNLESSQYVSNVERGAGGPSLEFIKAAVKLYKIDKGSFARFMGTTTENYYLGELR